MKLDWERLVVPAPGRIAVLPRSESEVTKSGLFLPVQSHVTPTVGTVISNCEPYFKDGEEYEPIFKIGEVVAFGQYSGMTIEIERQRIIILREIDVLATLQLDAAQDAVVDPD